MGCAPSKRGENKTITMNDKNDKKQKSYLLLI